MNEEAKAQRLERLRVASLRERSFGDTGATDDYISELVAAIAELQVEHDTRVVECMEQRSRAEQAERLEGDDGGALIVALLAEHEQEVDP